MARLGANPEELKRLRTAVLGWYDGSRRELPWRRSRDPYAIWVSEIMLQQTRVAVVVERYEAFMERFPTVFALAISPVEEVLALWSGLGYYRRARMLHKAAQVVTANYGGIIPATAERLRTLPGVGDYTSAAIASIAHGEAVAVVDGNVERVLCRLAGWDAAGGKGSAGWRRRVASLAAKLLDTGRPGDFNQAMMELGATVCAPRNPQCAGCPIAASCKTRGEHRTAPRPRSVTREAAYALCVRTGRGAGSGRVGREDTVLLEKRPDSVSVMPGMWELPALNDAGAGGNPLRMVVHHAIMNVQYVVRIHDVGEERITGGTVQGGERRWVPLSEAGNMALTGLARKVLKRSRVLAGPQLAMQGS